MIKYSSLISIFFIAIHISAQERILIAPFSIIDGDTFFLSDVPEIEVLEFKDRDERKKYYILKRRVLKVYPYALIAKEKLQDIKKGLDSIAKRRHKKRYTKEIAKWIREEYSEKLKSLTMSEGRILVKLIYRETKTTSYQIVKYYRGRFNAFFWQTMAKFWNNNLKTEYDPVNLREDMLIEHILTQARIEGKIE
ncbi:DUF4294 domain-containing protein [Flavobacteriales bacterium]|nr:DUF4294 domain-containing protein [Flavobacteriales bacterium]